MDIHSGGEAQPFPIMSLLLIGVSLYMKKKLALHLLCIALIRLCLLYQYNVCYISRVYKNKILKNDIFVDFIDV